MVFMRYLVIVGLILSAALNSSGQSKLPPVDAKRIPPKKARPTLFDRYDFGAQIKAMEQTEAPGPNRQMPRPLDSPNNTVPKDFKSKTDVPLTETAQEAVRMSEQWRAQQNQPAAGPDGRVLYSYGAGLPTVVCAPLRVCIVELEAGEKLIGEPHIGDAVRWNIAPATYGNGPTGTTLIVLKPQSAGLDTNLLITTDRRAYYLRLLSKPEDYVARVAFAYPEEEAARARWQQRVAEQKEREREASKIADLAPAGIESLYFDYRIAGGDEGMRPVRVLDDGTKTYIQMNPSVQHREAPVLVVVGPDGKPEMVNYRVKNNMYIVDRLFERAELVLGAGKKARKVEITRGTFQKK
jgi:type IV secretion system protein VirB9